MKDLCHECGGGFFPECLRSEDHGVRKAMEAYAQRATSAGKDEGTANGIALDDNTPLTVCVNSGDAYSLTLR